MSLTVLPEASSEIGLAITVGVRCTAPQGKLVPLDATDPVGRFAAALQSFPDDQENWVSLGQFRAGEVVTKGERTSVPDNYRSGELWVASSGVGVDLDNIIPGAEGKSAHVAIAPELATKVTELARHGKIPGSVFHTTPRGVRAFFILSRPVTEVSEWDRITKGVQRLFESFIADNDLGPNSANARPGLVLDSTVLKDRAKLIFAPIGTIFTNRHTPEHRRAEVVTLRPEPYSVEELAAVAPAVVAAVASAPTGQTTSTVPRRRKSDHQDVMLTEAITRYRKEHTPTGGWTVMNRTCPICGHNGCFNPLPSDPVYWFCFSSGHREVGHRNDAGWMGDVIDVHMHRAGKTDRITFLQETLDENGKPYLPAKYERIDHCGLDPNRFLFRMDDNLWCFREGDRGVDEGVCKEAFLKFLQSKGLNQRSRSAFLDSVPVVRGEVMAFDSDEPFVERNGSMFINTFKRPTLKPEAGDWKPIRDIVDNLCAHDQNGVQFVLDWLALQLQPLYRREPPLKVGTSLVFYGLTKGAGKNVFAEVLAALYGRENTFTIGQTELENRFNGFLDSKLLIVANEVFSSDNRSQATINRLKTWITEDRVTIEPKFRNAREVPSYFNLVMFSNDLRPVVIEHGDRRFSTFEVGSKIPVALGHRVADDARNGGPLCRAFLHELLTREVKHCQPFVPYVNATKNELEELSGNSAEKFIADLKTQGIEMVAAHWLRDDPGLRPGVHPGARAASRHIFINRKDGRRLMDRNDFIAVYNSYCHANNYSRLGTKAFLAFVRRLCPTLDVDGSVKLDGKPVRVVEGLPTAREVDDSGGFKDPTEHVHGRRHPIFGEPRYRETAPDYEADGAGVDDLEYTADETVN